MHCGSIPFLWGSFIQTIIQTMKDNELIEPAMLEESWQRILGSEFEKPYMQKLRIFLREEKNQKKVIFPKSENVFHAFKLTPFERVKVILLGTRSRPWID